MAVFGKYVGDTGRFYSTLDLGPLTNGVVVDFTTINGGSYPADGRWQSDAGPATYVPPVPPTAYTAPIDHGLAANRPAAAQLANQRYFATDTTVESYSDGSTWYTIGSAAYSAVSPRVPVVPAATLVCEDPYDTAATFTHPDVINIPAGWGADSNGKAWKYWMVNTPYWRASAIFENPCVFVSDDGIVWETPPGLTNPVDPTPGGTAANSDVDFCLVGSTLHLFYRQHDTSTGIETIMHRTSTNGITWSGETALFDSSLEPPLNRTNMISPSVAYDGTTYHMYYSKQSGQTIHRTSSDAATWSAETVVSLPTYPGNGFSHLDVVYDGGTFYLLTQDAGNASNSQTVNGARKLWMGRSTDGATFTYGALPFLSSEGFAQRMIYRSSIIHTTRNGKDYFRVWVSGASYSLDFSTVAQTQDAAGTGVESWYIGYTEGYDPNDLPANGNATAELSLYPSGDVVTPTGRVKGDEVGANRIFGRLVKGARGIFDRLRAVEMHSMVGYFEGGPSQLMGTQVGTDYLSEWAAGLGYTATNRIPPLVISSRATDSYSGGSYAAIDFHTRATDATVPVNDAWRVEGRWDGKLTFSRYNSATTTWTTYITLDTNGSLVLTGSGGFATSGASNNITSGGILIANGDRVRLSTAKTPTSSADGSGGVGDIARDDNFLYLKTSTGWKRATLATF